MKPTVIYLTHTTPSEIGNGGVHRSFQVLHELKQIVGPDNVWLLTDEFRSPLVNNAAPKDLNGARRQHQPLKQWASMRAGAATRFIKNPYRLFHRTIFGTGLHPIIKDYYSKKVKEMDGPAVCVIDHTRFTELIAINRDRGIPTVSCTQNLDALGDDFESLASNLAACSDPNVRTKQRLAVYATITDFANELQSLAQCEERLFISKIEAGLMSGLGLSCHYYPYLPVGELRQRQDEIRQKRLKSDREPGLFLLIGSASYAPIRKSCEWFITNAKQNSLPPGVRVVVLGAGTNKLLPQGESVPAVELKGWAEQSELDDLLVRAQAVLVPQQFGFGAPTRLAELSCAGIPVIGCQHPTFAIDPPPGFHLTEGTWDAWYERIEQLNCQNTGVTEADYNDWEAAQPKPLGKVVQDLLN